MECLVRISIATPEAMPSAEIDDLRRQAFVRQLINTGNKVG